ncbi:MAG TPA: hypothetical protein VGM83_18920 [Devosiaceae bacterium]|jgi:hypothetical protein
MMGFLAAIWARLSVPVLVIAGIAGAALVVLRQARQDGKNEILREQQETRDDLQKHYDQIDAGRPDLDASLGRLRDRATRAP